MLRAALRLAVPALTAVLCALPGVAAASTVSVDPVTGYAVFVSGPSRSDVTNDIRAPGGPAPVPFSPAVPFVDAAQALSAGAGCVAGLPVWCHAANADIRLGGGNDRYNGWSFDVIKVTGGKGSDDIVANGADTTASGGSGRDTISVGSNGQANAYGGRGDDNIRSIPGGVRAILGGGPGSDLVYGDRPEDQLTGGRGADDLIMQETADGTVRGGTGDDTILLLPGRIVIGQRTLHGGRGDDTIVGGQGTETVFGGAGDDTIDVSGDVTTPHTPDTVDCGPGYDTVYADASDVVADNCEKRLDGPMPANARVRAALARLADAFGVTVP